MVVHPPPDYTIFLPKAPAPTALPKVTAPAERKPPPAPDYEFILDMFFVPVRGAEPWSSSDPVRIVDKNPPWPNPKRFIRRRRPFTVSVH